MITIITYRIEQSIPASFPMVNIFLLSTPTLVYALTSLSLHFHTHNKIVYLEAFNCFKYSDLKVAAESPSNNSLPALV